MIPAAFRPDAVRLCQYISNTAQVPLRAADFDDDWEPVGATYRKLLADAELIDEQDGALTLTDQGRDLL